MGAEIGKSLSEKERLNCVQILTECLIIGFEEYLDTGSVCGSLEQSKAYREVGPHDAFSSCNHLGTVPWDDSSFQHNITFMFADQ